MPHEAAPPGAICADCRTPIAPGEPFHRAPEGYLCQPCLELREMAFGTLASKLAAAGAVRRGRRHAVPLEVAARVTMSRGDGTAGPAEPMLEISPRGFRIGVGRQYEVGQHLQCAATIPGRVGLPAQFDVEVRWCSRERADRFEIGVEVLESDADRFGPLYETLIRRLP